MHSRLTHGRGVPDRRNRAGVTTKRRRVGLDKAREKGERRQKPETQDIREAETAETKTLRSREGLRSGRGKVSLAKGAGSGPKKERIQAEVSLGAGLPSPIVQRRGKGQRRQVIGEEDGYGGGSANRRQTDEAKPGMAGVNRTE